MNGGNGEKKVIPGFEVLGLDESAESEMVPRAISVETVNGRRIPLIALRELNHHGKHVPSSTPATKSHG